MPQPGFRICPILPLASGPLWIAMGVAWVALAQIGAGLPMATAVAVIGCGTMGLVGQRRRQHPRSHCMPAGIVSLINLLVYIALTGLTIAAQWDLALRSPAGHPGPLMAVDHALAMLLLLRLTWRTASGPIGDSP